MKELFKQKWFQILIGFGISQAILAPYYAKMRKKHKEEEEELMKKTDKLIEKANREIHESFEERLREDLNIE